MASSFGNSPKLPSLDSQSPFVGTVEGTTDGMSDGIKEGYSDGDTDGEEVGLSEGLCEGMSEEIQGFTDLGIGIVVDN